MAHTIVDKEFGDIRVKRVHGAKHVRLKVTGEGLIVATLPKRAALKLVSGLIEDSRAELRKVLQNESRTPRRVYENNQRIGASHVLRFTSAPKPRVSVVGQMIIVASPDPTQSHTDMLQQLAREGVEKALKQEARSYLPRRLSHLAEKYGFHYSSLRFGNAKGRWGSCSSNGTISLNIALMTMPVDVIDYILVHELCHTKEMNHSERFWSLVENCLPNYRVIKKQLKLYNPYL